MSPAASRRSGSRRGWAAGSAPVLARAADAGKLTVINPALSLTIPYTLLGGIVGGALLSAASHGTDQLIVQRLLATRSLRDAQVALVGSGVVVMLQFALFLLVGIAIWAVGLAPDGMPGDQVFSGFIVHSLPAGIAGLVIAGILAAAMSSHSSAISALASAVTYDLYASITGRRDPVHLLRVGRFVSLVWGIGLMIAALGFHVAATRADTPAVVLALSIASITYGALLGTYVLAGRWPRARTRDVIAAVAVTVSVMLVVVFASRLADVGGPRAGSHRSARLAWPWYVPLGTLLAVGTGIASSLIVADTPTTGEAAVVIIVGVDAGGSKTRAVAWKDGEAVGQALGGAGAVRPGRALAAAGVIAEQARRVLANAGVLRAETLVVGAAGVGPRGRATRTWPGAARQSRWPSASSSSPMSSSPRPRRSAMAQASCSVRAPAASRWAAMPPANRSGRADMAGR